MSNKIETVSIGDLPIATELDDADELLLRDVSATLPENATARLSIATLRAAMGGGSPDRIESESGAAFAETTDDYQGFEHPGSIMGAESSDSYARVYTWAKSESSFASVWAGPERGSIGGVGFSALYNTASDEHTLAAIGAPLYVEEPTESYHAATKGYVDSASPAKIERTFSWGRSVVEVADDGDIELAVYLTGETAPLRRVRVTRGNTGGAIALMNRSGMGANDWQTELSLGTVSPSLFFLVSGGPSGGASSRGGLSFTGGRWYFTEQNGSQIPLGSPGYYALPSGVSSIKHGVHLAKEAYDTLASMPAPPDLEWWEPTWTAIENVDSVTNVECSYTRTYRAAGGSLVTLEGTITVTPETLADDSLIFSCPLPVPQVGSAEPLGWVGDTENRPGSMCAISGGSLMVIIESTSDAVRTASFRISYRAA